MKSLPPGSTLLGIAGISLIASLSAVCTAGEPATEPAETWTLTSQNDDVSIYSRTRPGATTKEYKAVGSVAAAPRTMLAVLDDIEAYPKFMPYITECRVIKREKNSLISYQRVSPPFCTDRDYSLRVKHETKNTKAGMVYICRWELVNDQGPAERSDVLRLKINEGSWTLESADDNTTRATYCIYADCGTLPAWLAAKANQVAIGKLFEAIRKQVKEAKYADAK